MSEKADIFYNTLDEIEKMFDNAGIWYDVYSTDYYHDVISYGNHYEIDIEIDGDWKHDHLYADKLVKDRFGNKLVDINEYDADEDDINGDTYKSVHEYKLRY